MLWLRRLSLGLLKSRIIDLAPLRLWRQFFVTAGLCVVATSLGLSLDVLLGLGLDLRLQIDRLTFLLGVASLGPRRSDRLFIFQFALAFMFTFLGTLDYFRPGLLSLGLLLCVVVCCLFLLSVLEFRKTIVVVLIIVLALALSHAFWRNPALLFTFRRVISAPICRIVS
ncbi:hypothetical protein BKA81DRAFT_369524 [Phyllosticta paracitricarpa]